MNKIYKKKQPTPLFHPTSKPIKIDVMPGEMTLKFILGYAAAYRCVESKWLPKIEYVLN